MSWLGDVIGDRAPNLKNLHNVLWAKLAQNNLGGKIKYMWRGFTASIADAAEKFVHKFQDMGLHFKRLNSRQVKLLNMLEKGHVPTEDELVGMYKRGDAQKAQQQAEKIFKVIAGIGGAEGVMSKVLTKTKQRVEDEATGRTEAQKAREMATALDNMKVIQAEAKFAQLHPHWRKDWDRHLIVFGESEKGVDGVASHFRKEYGEAVRAAGGSINPTQYDVMLKSALQVNLKQLQAHQTSLEKELDDHLNDAKKGLPINPERVNRLQAAAAFDAIEYIQRCLAPGEDAEALRRSLITKYGSALGLDSSINPDIGEPSTDGARAEYNKKIQQAMEELQKKGEG